jgi:hypothetical protein
MKIAICISGFLRTWEYTKKSFIEQLLQDKDNEYDLFIHTYYQNLYEFTAEKSDKVLSKQEIEDLFTGLNIKVLSIENRDETLPLLFKESEKYKHVSNYGLQQQESSDKDSISIPIGVRTYDHLRKLHLCNESRKIYERENNITYDLVVKTRFDLCYFNSPDWKICLDGKVYFELGACFGWPNDTFCITTPYVMDNWYANRFTKLEEMFITGTNLVGGICAHATLKWILEQGNIEISNIRMVNTNCFRSENSMQFYDNYKYKCNIDELYDKMINSNIKDVYQLENYKRQLLI